MRKQISEQVVEDLLKRNEHFFIKLNHGEFDRRIIFPKFDVFRKLEKDDSYTYWMEEKRNGR